MFDADLRRFGELIDTLLNFAPLSSLPAALEKDGLSAEERLRLMWPVGATTFAREHFGRSEERCTQRNRHCGSALERLTRARELRRAVRKEGCALSRVSGDAWEKARGESCANHLILLVCDQTIFNDQAHLAGKSGPKTRAHLVLMSTTNSKIAMNWSMRRTSSTRAANIAPSLLSLAAKVSRRRWRVLHSWPGPAFCRRTGATTNAGKKFSRDLQRLQKGYADSIEANAMLLSELSCL